MAKKPNWAADSKEIDAIVSGKHRNPFGLLGLHQFGKNWVARAFIPTADIVIAQTISGEAVGELSRVHEAGLFEGIVNVKNHQQLRYECANAGGYW